MWVFRSITEHLDLDARQVVAVSIGATTILAILGMLGYIRFGIWRLAHPDAPWWTWMF